MNNNKVLNVVFLILIAIAITIQFVSYDLIIELIKEDMSEDGIIEASTHRHYQVVFSNIKLLLIIIPILLIIWLNFYTFFGKIIHDISLYIFKLLRSFFNKITFKHIFIFSLFIIISFMIWAMLNFDIGLDEAFYLNDIQNIEKFGDVTRVTANSTFQYYIPNLPFNLVAKAVVDILGFSIFKIRLIVVLFSLLFLYLLHKLLSAELLYLVIPLVFFIPGFYTLSSIIYLEPTAISFIILGLYMLKHYEYTKKNHFMLLSAFSFSIAMATKLQLILWIGIIVTILMISEYKNFAKILFKILLLTYFFLIIFIFLPIFKVGYKDIIILLKAYFIGGNTSGALQLNTFIFMPKLMMLNELFVLPLMIFLWIKTHNIIWHNYNKLYMKFIYVGAIIIPIHWVFFYHVLTWRNVFIGIVFNLILLAIYLKKNKRAAKLVIFIYLFIGIVSNFVFIKGGVIDNVQYYRAHVLDSPISLETDNSQEMFFSKATKIIESNEKVYVPLQPFIARLFLKKNKIQQLPKNIDSIEAKSYLIVTAGDVKEGYVNKPNCKEYISHAELICNAGKYSLYQLEPKKVYK